MSFNPEKSLSASQDSTVEQHASEKMEGDIESVESKSEAQEVDMESLKNALDTARDDYARVLQKRESTINKLKQFLGDVDTGQDVDSEVMRSAYSSSLSRYREAHLAQIDQLPEEQKKEALAGLKAFELQESCNLVDSHSKAKAETFGGKCGEMIQKTADWYKKVPTKYKIAVSATLFAGGLATGVGAAAGVLGAAAMVKRILGATAAGVGATGWMEARAQKKEQAHVNETMDNFKNLSIEDQMAHLKGFDDTSFQKIDEMFQGKLADRQKRVMVGIGAAAGIMALGDAGKIFSVGEAAAAEIPVAEQTVVETVENTPKGGNAALIQRAMEEMHAQKELAKNAAQGIGVNTENITATFQNESPVEINGQAVPQEATMVESVEKIQNVAEQPAKKDLLASLNKMKGTFGASQEIPSATVQPNIENTSVPHETVEVASPQTVEAPKVKEDIAGRLNAMKKVFPSESAHVEAVSGVAKSVEAAQSTVAPAVEQVAPSGNVSMAEHAAPKMEKPPVMSSAPTMEKIPTGVMSLAQEKAVIAEMVKDPQFNNSIAAEIKKLYGLPASNIGRTPMGLLENNNAVTQQQVDRVVNLARKYLGDEVAMPKNNTTIGTYFTRIAAHAASKKIPLDKIFV